MSNHGKGASHTLGLIVLFVLLFLILLWFIPWVAFWAIGVLFDYHIPLNWGTFFAFWALKLFVISGGVRASNSQ